MSKITAKQRAKDLEDRRAVETEASTMTDAEKLEFTRNLSTRDRLMRRLSSTKITTKLRDDLGEFEVQTRMFTSLERTHFLDLNRMLSESKSDAEKYKSAMDELKHLAAEISVDPGPDYYEGDTVSDDVVLIVLLNAFNGAAKHVTEVVASFRP